MLDIMQGCTLLAKCAMVISIGYRRAFKPAVKLLVNLKGFIQHCQSELMEKTNAHRFTDMDSLYFGTEILEEF